MPKVSSSPSPVVPSIPSSEATASPSELDFAGFEATHYFPDMGTKAWVFGRIGDEGVRVSFEDGPPPKAVGELEDGSTFTLDDEQVRGFIASMEKAVPRPGTLDSAKIENVLKDAHEVLDASSCAGVPPSPTVAPFGADTFE